MKSTERHRIKEDQFIATLSETFARFDQNRQQWIWVTVGIVVLVVAVGGFSWWRQQRNASASALLADALVVADAPVAPPTPPPAPGQAASTAPAPQPGSYPTERARYEAALPKFLAAADAYPSTQAGLSARYQAAATLVALGRDEEATRQYQQVIDKDGNSLYGRMARLGLAEVQVRQGKFDPAINTYKELTATAKDDLPVDGILMALGRAYAAAGKKTEAGQTFKRIGDEFPSSPYAPVAKRELDAINNPL